MRTYSDFEVNTSFPNDPAAGFLETVVEGGQRAEVTFSRLIKGGTTPFCMTIEYSKGPNMAGERSDSTLRLLLTSPALPLFQVDAEMGRGVSGQQTYGFSMDISLPVQVSSSKFKLRLL